MCYTYSFRHCLPHIQKTASGCDEDKNVITLDLAAVVQKAKEHDKIRAGSGDDLHVIPPTGFVFHESRVGSTLVANSLTAMNTEGHRVYSESDPINEALKACQGILSTCTMEAKIELFRDVGKFDHDLGVMIFSILLLLHTFFNPISRTSILSLFNGKDIISKGEAYVF